MNASPAHVTGAIEVATDRLLEAGANPDDMLVDVHHDGRAATLYLKGRPMFSARLRWENDRWEVDERWLAEAGDRRDAEIRADPDAPKPRFREGVYEHVRGANVTTLHRI